MYAAAVWLRQVKEVYGDRLQLNWKNFSLEQINNKQGPEWFVWDQPDDYPSRSLPAFRAVEAARLQGEDAYERMHFALLEGRHERRKDYREPADIEEMARGAGLDMPRFKRDYDDRKLLRRVSEDHLKSVKYYGTFGTPTFVFENGSAFFMRIKPHESKEEAARTFDGLYQVFVKQPANIDEVKRPRKQVEA